MTSIVSKNRKPNATSKNNNEVHEVRVLSVFEAHIPFAYIFKWLVFSTTFLHDNNSSNLLLSKYLLSDVCQVRFK